MNIRLSWIGLLTGVLYWNGALAEVTIPNLISSARSVSEAESYDSDYLFVKSNYELANGPQLFYAAVVEAHLGDKTESLKYLISGQIRSTTDMSLFKPASETDERLMADLYGMIFYQFGGAGGNDIYKDEAKYSKIFENIRAYQPIFNETYNPGWNHIDSPSKTEYSEKITQGKEHRLKQLTDLVSLLKNEEYVALSKELDEIKNDPESSKRSLEIINKMREISGAPKVVIQE